MVQDTPSEDTLLRKWPGSSQKAKAVNVKEDHLVAHVKVSLPVSLALSFPFSLPPSLPPFPLSPSLRPSTRTRTQKLEQARPHVHPHVRSSQHAHTTGLHSFTEHVRPKRRVSSHRCWAMVVPCLPYAFCHSCINKGSNIVRAKCSTGVCSLSRGVLAASTSAVSIPHEESVGRIA